MIDRRPLVPVLASLALLTAPGLALAHPGHEGLTGFSAGLAHPWGGFDHLLAMLAVGLWSGQHAGRARWGLPASFVGAMALGSAIGMAGAASGVQLAIVLSVVVLGALVATSVRMPLVTAAVLVGAFGLAHGAAHGSEIPASASGLTYAIGFVLATSSLHAAGVALSTRVPLAALIRGSGAAIAASGLVLLIGALA